MTGPFCHTGATSSSLPDPPVAPCHWQALRPPQTTPVAPCHCSRSRPTGRPVLPGDAPRRTPTARPPRHATYPEGPDVRGLPPEGGVGVRSAGVCRYGRTDRQNLRVCYLHTVNGGFERLERPAGGGSRLASSFIKCLACPAWLGHAGGLVRRLCRGSEWWR